MKMAKEKHEKFLLGSTPTYFVCGIDMFIQCATWFDSKECWDEKIVNESTLLANVGLPEQYRTDQLKLYTFVSGTTPQRSLWRHTNIAFTLFHLYLQEDSHMYVIDGYPKEVWNIVESKLKDFIIHAWFSDPRAYKVLNKIEYIQVATEREFLRERGNIEVLADEHERLYQSHLLLEEEDIPGFVEYQKCMYAKLEDDYKGKVSPYAGGLSADPLTMEELDEMYDDDDDEDGSLQ